MLSKLKRHSVIAKRKERNDLGHRFRFSSRLTSLIHWLLTP